MSGTLTAFDRLLCQTAAHLAGATPSPDVSKEQKDCPVFVVSEVVNASGGRTGCFLYRGTLVTPAPRSRTPDCCPLRRGGAGGDEAGRAAPQLDSSDSQGDDEEQQLDLARYDGQDLTLYMSYEEASPKIKRRTMTSSAPVAPWRVIVRDQRDDMIFCVRGLAPQMLMDDQLRLMVWGSTIAVSFPTTEDAQAFADGMARVEVEKCCLAGSPQAALLEALAAEHTMSSSSFAFKPSSGSTCPPSPAPLEQPLQHCVPMRPAAPRLLAMVGSKRRAEAPPTMLATPAVKPRFLFTATLLTPMPSFELRS